MACPQSPEPDGFHRYILRAGVATAAAVCVYCQQPRVLVPATDPTSWQQRRRDVLTARSAAREAALRNEPTE
jgi:hypothetical protein